ncbi:MAG: T9SS type A sorting domain-containing protein, partial [Candidatus Cloacimonas acidaminovorans]
KGTLEIYNVKGQKVRVWNCLPSGEHKIVFNGCNEQGLPLPSGIYFGIMKTQNKVQIRKMVLIK